MRKSNLYLSLLATLALVLATACSKDYLELNPKGTKLESNYYQTEDEVFQGLVAAYDPLQWGATTGKWTMLMGLMNAASDDCYAGGSNASDQPAWVATDNFTLSPTLGPQLGLWDKGYTGIYRANLVLEKTAVAPAAVSVAFKARTVAEAKFLRGYYYFDLVRLFGNIPLITKVLTPSEIYTQKQTTPQAVYAQIESDLRAAIAEPQLPESTQSSEAGRVTKPAVRALLAKVLLYENDMAKMGEAASLFGDVINSGYYNLEPKFADVFKPSNKFGPESVFEIQYSSNQAGGWESFTNGTEGNLDVIFCGMRDFVGSVYSLGYGFTPVTETLAADMKADPRFAATIIDGAKLKAAGASYSAGYQNTDFFCQKYAPQAVYKATLGEQAVNWGYNYKVIRLADVYLMAAEALVRGGGDEILARTYLNKVRNRVGLPSYGGAGGSVLLDAIYSERRFELATEGHRFFDLVRTGKASTVLASQGYNDTRNRLLPIPQLEIDQAHGALVQNAGY